MPAVAFTDAAGKPHMLSEFRGKYVLLNMWATWCGPCVKELPALAKLQTEVPRGFTVVPVNVGRSTAAETKSFLAAHQARLKPGLPFYLGGEECFCSRETGPADTPSNFGALSRKAIAQAGLRVLYAERPSLLAEHGFTTGYIPLASFEKPAQPSRMKIGLQADGAGCAPEGLPEEKRALAIVTDDFQHEHATCFNVKGKGLVVMTSCGHRGVVNSVRGAIKVSGISKVHAILDGFHLMPMPEDYVRSTVAALQEFNPDYLIPMHCTGTTFYEVAKQALPGRVLLSSTGTRFTFGA